MPKQTSPTRTRKPPVRLTAAQKIPTAKPHTKDGVSVVRVVTGNQAELLTPPEAIDRARALMLAANKIAGIAKEAEKFNANIARLDENDGNDEEPVESAPDTVDVDHEDD